VAAVAVAATAVRSLVRHSRTPSPLNDGRRRRCRRHRLHYPRERSGDYLLARSPCRASWSVSWWYSRPSHAVAPVARSAPGSNCSSCSSVHSHNSSSNNFIGRSVVRDHSAPTDRPASRSSTVPACCTPNIKYQRLSGLVTCLSKYSVNYCYSIYIKASSPVTSSDGRFRPTATRNSDTALRWIGRGVGTSFATV